MAPSCLLLIRCCPFSAIQCETLRSSLQKCTTFTFLIDFFKYLKVYRTGFKLALGATLHHLISTYSPSDSGEVLRTLIGTVVASYCIGWIIRYCRIRQVGRAYFYDIYNLATVSKEESEFAQRNGCQPVLATLPYKWPFALDLLKHRYDALPGGQLLDFQTKYLMTCPTIRINIVGEGYILTEPANIEAVLNSRFDDFVMGSRQEGLFPLLG